MRVAQFLAIASLLVVSSLAHVSQSVDPDWEILGPAPNPQLTFPITFALKQANKEQLEQIFWSVSDPRSNEYGNYLSLDQVAKLVSPTKETKRIVVNWLVQHDIDATTCIEALTGDFLTCNIELRKAESLLRAKFFEFNHSENKERRIVRALSYELPEEISPHVDFVGGVVGFPIKHQVKKLQKNTVGSVISVGPKELRQRYNISDNIVGTQTNNSQAVAEFQGQYYSPSDLTSFFNKFVSNSKASKVFKDVGNNDPSSPGVEANLDIQFIMGVAPNVKSWFWSNPQFDFWSDLTNWMAQISSTQNPPLVHSVSYGSQGNYPSESYRTRLNTEFQKAGARGLSIIFASGDSGTGCSACNRFQPSFPATSPYVTSVGATEFISARVGPERAVQSFGSGGGFSLFFPRPSYQNDSVNHYFQVQSDLPSSSFYNKNGRGTPDVSALGIGFQVFVSGEVQSVGGTSASAPTFAGIVSLLNDIRLKNGKASLGFLNPWIYQTAASRPDAFFDVTEGNNRHGCCGLTGFKAAPGWDPVTGVGTPNFSVLSQLV